MVHTPEPVKVVQHLLGAPTVLLALPTSEPMLLLAASPTLIEHSLTTVNEWAHAVTVLDILLFLLSPVLFVVAFYGPIALLAIVVALIIG